MPGPASLTFVASRSRRPGLPLRFCCRAAPPGFKVLPNPRLQNPVRDAINVLNKRLMMEQTLDFKLPEELQLLQKTAREFAEAELSKPAREMDEREEFRVELFKKLASLGLAGLTLPEQYG